MIQGYWTRKNIGVWVGDEKCHVYKNNGRIFSGSHEEGLEELKELVK